MKKAFFFICGIESTLKKKYQQDIAHTKMDTSINELPFWKDICNINTVISIALAGFLVAFLNKYD